MGEFQRGVVEEPEIEIAGIDGGDREGAADGGIEPVGEFRRGGDGEEDGEDGDCEGSEETVLA